MTIDIPTDGTKSKELKYIIVLEEGRANAIIFPSHVCHITIAESIGLDKLISAGFCILNWEEGELQVSVHGGSDSILAVKKFPAAISHGKIDEIIILCSMCSGEWDYIYQYEIVAELHERNQQEL